jgi:hypothetical protein
MKLNKTILYAAGGLLVVAFAGMFAAPRVSAAIRATFVEIVIPSRPYNVTTTLDSAAFRVFGPDSGTLGVTTMTFANFSAGAEQISIFQAGVAGGDCSSGTVVSVNSPAMNFVLQPNATLVIPYPSPLVFTGIGGHTCIYAQVSPNPGAGSRVEMGVTGFVN